MKTAIKLRLLSGWKVLLAWNIGLVLWMLVSPISASYTEGIGFYYSTKSMMFTLFMFVSTIGVLLYICYFDYDIGKTRWLLIRNRHMICFVSDTFVITIQLLLVYILLYITTNNELYQTIEQLYPTKSAEFIEQIAQQTLQGSWFTKTFLQLNVVNAGLLTLSAITIATWCHGVAVSLLFLKQKPLDWIMRLSILAFVVLCGNHLVALGVIGVMLCVYFLYGCRLWVLSRIVK